MRAGVYRHYKGPLYLVLGVAHDANAEDLYPRAEISRALEEGMWHDYQSEPLGDREVVVYVPLQLDGAHLGPRMAVRTRSDFESPVCASTACGSYGQALGPHPDPCRDHALLRFRFVGEHLQEGMKPQ